MNIFDNLNLQFQVRLSRLWIQHIAMLVEYLWTKIAGYLTKNAVFCLHIQKIEQAKDQKCALLFPLKKGKVGKCKLKNLVWMSVNSTAM